MATLKDVARLACVDVSTVSRALNNASCVHPDTKAKVLEAVQQLSYQPNLLAKGLRQGKRHTIGLVIPNIKLNIFGEIAEYIELEARKLGYGVMICNTQNDPEQEAACLNRLRNGFVDGIIIASTGQNRKLLHNIRSSGISVVQLIRAQDKSISSIVADYYACAYDGVGYLVSKGCKHIGLINGNLEITPYEERYKGYQQAIKEHALKENVSKSRVPRYDNFTDGYKGANYLLDTNSELDAILVAVDMQGIGAIRSLKERKLAICDKVKIISLTGHSIGGMLETPMTSMEIPAKNIGQKITELIIEDIEAPPNTNAEALHITLKSSLVVRETA